MVENRPGKSEPINLKLVKAMGTTLALSGATLFAIGAARVPDNIFPSDTTENDHSDSVSNVPGMHSRQPENNYPSMSSQVALEFGSAATALGTSIVLFANFYRQDENEKNNSPLHQ